MTRTRYRVYLQPVPASIHNETGDMKICAYRTLALEQVIPQKDAEIAEPETCPEDVAARAQK